MDADLFFFLLIATGMAGALLAVVLRHQDRTCASASFGAAALSALFGTIVSILVLTGSPMSLQLPFDTPFGHFGFTLDRLSAFFLLVISVVSFAVSIYSIGYSKEYDGKYSIGLLGFLFNLFLLSMTFVISASNAIFFLIVWEAMSLTSYLLVVYENRKDGIASSGLLYVVMTHLGTALIMIALIMMGLYTQDHSFDFSSYSGVGALMPSALKSTLFVLLFIGFGTKAGIIPLHVWLPYAHPAAPSNVSALMSGVMVKTAIFMMIRTFFDFLGVTDTWWGLLVLLAASISALLGVMYALMETDIKRVLAYSTVENVGIILIGLGAAMVFQSYNLSLLAGLALIATLLHVMNHALFKGALFMGAGSILFATHTRDMEKLGGLAKRMKWTGIIFFIGALSIAAIPPFNGFVSEWLIFQSLLQSFQIADVTVKILLPVAIAVLALTGALAAVCFVRLFGITFLAKPRSEHAEHAKEVPRTMLVGSGIVAFLCIATGVMSFAIIPYVDQVTTPLVGVSAASSIVNGFVISPTNDQFSTMSPFAVAILIAIMVPLVIVISNRYGGKRTTVVEDTWDCGTPLTAHNQYTGTAYSNPLVRVFSYIYRPRPEVRTESTSSPYVKKKVSYAFVVVPVFEKYLYQPVVGSMVFIARRVTRIQAGSIQAYLAYIFATLVFLLIIFR
ncbi:MAG TPA: hydrogenase 4 subunit B [Methanomassiliicoccales archaeon]